MLRVGGLHPRSRNLVGHTTARPRPLGKRSNSFLQKLKTYIWFVQEKQVYNLKKQVYEKQRKNTVTRTSACAAKFIFLQKLTFRGFRRTSADGSCASVLVLCTCTSDRSNLYFIKFRFSSFSIGRICAAIMFLFLLYIVFCM